MAKQTNEPGRSTKSRGADRKRPQDPRSPTSRRERRQAEALDRQENPDLDARKAREAAYPGRS